MGDGKSLAYLLLAIPNRLWCRSAVMWKLMCAWFTISMAPVPTSKRCPLICDEFKVADCASFRPPWVVYRARRLYDLATAVAAMVLAVQRFRSGCEMRLTTFIVVLWCEVRSQWPIISKCSSVDAVP